MLVIERAAKRMTLTRVESLGQLPVSPVTTDLGIQSREVVDETRAAWPERAIKLELRGDLQGYWDVARVEQAIANLISNALQYGDPRKPVHVSVDGQDGSVVLKVRNEGPPIDPRLIPRLFEPFSRGAPDASPHGLGLGLYIVRQIAVAHRGSVDVTSSADDGTVFALILPRSACDPADS